MAGVSIGIEMPVGHLARQRGCQMKLIRYNDLRARGIVKNRVTLRRWIASNGFPAPFRLGRNTIAWPEEAVRAWLDTRGEPRVSRAQLEAEPQQAGLRAGSVQP